MTNLDAFSDLQVADVVGLKNLKPVMLELGGKCPALIMEDADLAQAAQLCVTGGKF